MSALEELYFDQLSQYNIQYTKHVSRWKLCAGELSKLLLDFEKKALPSTSSKLDDSIEIRKHHGDNPSCRNIFVKDVELVSAGFTINPFEVVSFTPINNTGIQFNVEVEKNSKLIPQIGEEQLLNFWTN